jgi:hypothetical protein
VHRFPLDLRAEATCATPKSARRSSLVHSIFGEIAVVIPTVLAVAFLIWVFWNFCKEFGNRKSKL